MRRCLLGLGGVRRRIGLPRTRIRGRHVELAGVGIRIRSGDGQLRGDETLRTGGSRAGRRPEIGCQRLGSRSSSGGLAGTYPVVSAYGSGRWVRPLASPSWFMPSRSRVSNDRLAGLLTDPSGIAIGTAVLARKGGVEQRRPRGRMIGKEAEQHGTTRVEDGDVARPCRAATNAAETRADSDGGRMIWSDRGRTRRASAWWSPAAPASRRWRSVTSFRRSPAPRPEPQRPPPRCRDRGRSEQTRRRGVRSCWQQRDLARSMP